MNTIILNHEKIYTGNLLLVNADYPLHSFSEKNLIPAESGYPTVLLHRDAANMLQLVLEKISAGHKIVPVSGYRSAEEQTAIYTESLRDNGMEYTKKFVAVPYHSEHQTGLAIDLGLNQENIDFICPNFPYDGICSKFRKEASHYGFIERYPEGKENITGIAHEPWHFRYVGYPHSEVIEEQGFTLEEYINYLKNIPYDGEHLIISDGGRDMEVFYLPANQANTTISLPEDAVYQVSGNNIDGFIITLWRRNHD